MAETKIGGVHVSASIGTAEYVADAKKLKAETASLERSLKGSFNSMAVAAKGFGGAMAAGLSIGLIAGAAKKALDFAAAIGTTAKQLNVTTKELQTFRYAAQQVGIQNAEADKGLEKLGITLGKAAAGSVTAKKALGAVGVTLEDIKTKSRTEIFGQIADQMIKQGGAAKNAAAGAAIMGEGFSKLVPLLDQGSKGINQLSGAAERLGVVLSDRQIQQADETARKLDDVKTVLAAQIAGVVADNASSIVSLANALGQLTSSIINFLGSNPQAALGILGALAGSRFGVPGAAAGGLAGMFAGGRMAGASADANMDPRFRAAQLRKAQAEYRRRNVPGNSPQYIGFSKRELDKQAKLARQALAITKRQQGTKPPTADIPQFLAPDPKNTRTRTRKPPRDRSEDVLFQFQQEQRRAEMDILRAKMDLSHDYVERTQLSLQMVALEKASFEAELKDRVRRAERDFAEGKITADALAEAKTQAESLKLKNDEKSELERQAILNDQRTQWLEETLQIDQQGLSRRREELEGQLSLAKTAAERRDIQLRILELDKQAEKAALEKVMADKTASNAAKLDAEARLQSLNRRYSTAAQGVAQNTMGPWEQFASTVPQTAAQMQEAFQGVAVNGVGAITEGLLDAIEGTKSLGDAFREVAQGIIRELLRIMIQKMLVQAVGSALGMPAVPGMAGGGSISVGSGVPGLAGGGSLFVRGRRGLDRNMLALNGLPIARVDYGERIDVSNDNPSRGMQMGPTHFHFPGVTNAKEARQAGIQAAGVYKREVARAMRTFG